ncbi:MAG: glutamate-5-semialdehyde dehydrogenase [Candidatus Firestonebacteria bacterium]
MIKAKLVKDASLILYNSSTKIKNELLKKIIQNLNKEVKSILKANEIDIKKGKKNNLSKALIDRLTLNEKRINQMIVGINDVIKLPDPVGVIFDIKERPNGLKVGKMRVPLGAIGIIYEARPNVTVDAAVLCLKAGNSVLLKGGREAINSNKKLAQIIKDSLKEVNLPESCVEFIDTVDRQAVMEMIKQDKYLDVIIPRGSQSLINLILENATVPVIAHGEGNCHIFVDETANLNMAEEIVFNAKTQRPSVCNAMEKLLVHKKIAKGFLPRMIERLRRGGVEIRGDGKTLKIIKEVKLATEEDWYKEYLDLILAVKIVDNLDVAIKHINFYGSHHSEAIVTGNKKNADRFLREVDSSAVFINASTRFTDGYEFGLGAEIGISTQKLHARGPMGLVELTSAKFVVYGTGQTRK